MIPGYSGTSGGSEMSIFGVADSTGSSPLDQAVGVRQGAGPAYDVIQPCSQRLVQHLCVWGVILIALVILSA